MCLTIPRQIKKINGQQAELAGGRQVSIALVSDLKEGDWILTSADLAVSKINKQEAKETLDYFLKGGERS